MAKWKVAVLGSPLKTVTIDDALPAQVAALQQQMAAFQAAGTALRHSQLQGLQIGDDHPQYTMWAANETITAPWNFQAEPYIEGELLTEFIEDVVGGSGFIQDTASITWTYGDTAGTLEANVVLEWLQDRVGDMLTDSSSIDFTYNDGAGTFTAAVIDEYVQDLVGTMATDSSTIDFTYNDSLGTLSAAVIQSYAYVWTAKHKFTNSYFSGGALEIEADVATWIFTESDAAAGAKRWLNSVNSGQMNYYIANDNDTVLSRYLQAIRSGSTLASMAFGNSTDNAPMSFYGNIVGPQDNYGIQLGALAGGDLVLYHDGTNSYVKNNTGLLQFYLNSATQDALFSPNTDWNLTGVTETPNIIAERVVKVLRAGSSSAPTFRGYSYGSGGSRTSPAACVNGDGLFAFDGAGYDGSGFGVRWYLRAFAGETWSSTVHGSYGLMGTTAIGDNAARNTIGFWSNGGIRLLLDNAEISLGAGSSNANDASGDLRLLHDGTNSLIRNDTGELRLQFSTTVGLAIETSGATDVRQQFQVSNAISPAQLTGNTDNWSPTGLSTASVIRLSTDAARDITGIAAQPGGTLILLCNIGTQNAVLKHDVTSTAANRFLCPGSADFTLNANDSVKIWYDPTSSRWRVVAY